MFWHNFASLAYNWRHAFHCPSDGTHLLDLSLHLQVEGQRKVRQTKVRKPYGHGTASKVG
jgi:hypothetical protein